MKKLLSFFAFIAITGLVVAQAQTHTSTIGKNTTKVVFTNKSTPSRLRMPAHQRISAEYLDGILNIEFQIPEGECKLEYIVTSTYQYRYTVFDSNSPTDINIGSVNGRIELTITTSFGNEYEAIIDFDE